MQFIVAGAGIGGLTVAVALAKRGHGVQVLEQAPEPRPVGAGISLQPNAMRALAKVELDSAVMQRGCASAIARLRWANGKLIRHFYFSPVKEKYGYLPYTIHRADLFDVLYGAANDLGVDVRFGSALESFNRESSAVHVNTADGQSYLADALIGADGINSRVRSQLWGDAPTRYSGYICWRGIVTNPDLVQRVDTMNEVWGKASRCGFMRCSPDKVYWFATKSSPLRGRPDPTWKDHFADWPEPIHDLMVATPEAETTFNDISDRKPIFPWSQGNVTLLGDAAHPMTPNFGQGGAQAIEDAVVLAQKVSDQDSIDASFVAYESQRHPRTKRFVDDSLRFGRVAQGGNAFWRFVRRRVIPLIPDSVTNRQLDWQFNIKDQVG